MPRRSAELPRRSCLTVPGSSDRMLSKAAKVPTDMVILDLEDSVAPAEKDRARAAVGHAVRALDWGSRVVGVRINGWMSPWTVGDVQAVVEGGDGRLDVVVLPKVEDPSMVQALDMVLRQAEHAAGLQIGDIGIEAQIETARGVQGVADICRASPRLEAVDLGPLDLAASLGMPPRSSSSGRRFEPIASAMVVAARAAGVQVIDGPFVDVRDVEGLREDARAAADAGFDGKWVLHPDQVEVVEDAFSPSEDAVDRARRVLAAYEASIGRDRRGAVLVDGEMVDEATCRIARTVVARARQRADQEEM